MSTTYYISLVRRALEAEGWTLTEPQVRQAYPVDRLNIEGFEAEHPCGARREITYRPADPVETIAVRDVGGAGDNTMWSLFTGIARLLRIGIIPTPPACESR